MRNRAQCAKCKVIVESSARDKTDVCDCGEISVSGGDLYGCSSKDWTNFLRVDDNGNVVIPKVIDRKPPTREELLSELQHLVDRIEAMPREAMIVSINHYDYASLLILLIALFRSEDASSESSDGIELRDA